MRQSIVTASAAALLLHPGALAAQQPSGASGAADSTADSAAHVAEGARAGAVAGAAESVAAIRWTSAGATFLLTPFLGGVGTFLVSSHTPGEDVIPGAVPATVAGGTPSPAYAAAYRRAYRAAYLPRRKRTMRRAALVTTGVFFVAMVGLSG